LFLDIWVPANATAGSNLPVKFWIYGGADTGGSISDPLYDGCPLATDAVVVSAAYRLGPLGFLAVESAGISGNFGLQDLELALRWVKRHVAAFGGDPVSSSLWHHEYFEANLCRQNKVVVFGQSAGAALTWILSSLPQAPTLMNAAIAESGSGRNLLTNAEYQGFGKEYAKILGCDVTDVSRLLWFQIPPIYKYNYRLLAFDHNRQRP
jgi:carboxylesterase type B